MLFHVFAHVYAHHRLFAVKEEVGQRASQLGLAYACGAYEQERTDGAVRVGETGTAAADGVGHGNDCLVLAHNTLMQHFFQPHQLVHLAFHEARDGDVRPAAHHFGDVFGFYFFFEHHFGGLDFGQVLRGLRYFGFCLWDAGEAYFGGASQIARTGERFGVGTGFVQGFF